MVWVRTKMKKQKKSNFNWNEELDFTFVSAVHKHKAYKRTKGCSIEDKFKLVTANLLGLPIFKNADINDDMLFKKWSRLTKQIETKYALDGAGANLSGLSDEPPELDKLVMLMLKEKVKLKDTAAKLKGKEREECY